MRTERVLVCSAFAVVVALGSVVSTATCQPVGATTGGDCGLIVMADGDLLLAHLGALNCPRPQDPWAVKGNIFSSAGASWSPIVGMSPTNLQALAANGDWFQLEMDYNYCNGALASRTGNVFQLTGSGQPGETFAMFGGVFGMEYAVTTLGNVYRWESCGWDVVGNIYGGPTSAHRSSWGDLKLTYR